MADDANHCRRRYWPPQALGLGGSATARGLADCSTGSAANPSCISGGSATYSCDGGAGDFYYCTDGNRPIFNCSQGFMPR